MKDILKPVIYAGLFAIPFVPFLVSSSLFFPFITTKAFAFRIIVEVVFAAWIILALLYKEYRPRRSIILYSLFIFLGIIGLADIFGAAPVKSFWSNAERMEGYIALLHLGTFFLVIGSVFDESNWRRWWNTSLAASALMVVYALFQLAGALEIHQGGVRVTGTLGNAAYMAVYMLIHIYIALLMLWRTRKSTAMRWIYGLLIAVQVLILYYTATRGAILGLLGGLLLLALLNIKNKEDAGLRRAASGILIALVVLVSGFIALRNTSFVLESPVLARFANITTAELHGGGRSFIWPMAIEGVKERPLLGWGQENFNYVFNEHYDPDMHGLEPWFDRAHNIFLDWAAAGGILGLVSYLSLYGALLYIIWKRSPFAYADKTILTSLIAAYFFHNLFVFDHLISYILFFSLLAYAHSVSEGKIVAENFRPAERRVNTIALPLVAVLLALTLYFVNILPMSANASVINALRALQTTGGAGVAAEHFRSAYDTSRLDRTVIVEQIAANAVPILNSDLPPQERNEYFRFARGAVEGLANNFHTDARHQILAGSFLAKTGQLEEALAYYARARELMPEKQAVYFGAGNAYLLSGDFGSALVEFKTAYELAPAYMEAKVVYLAGAIYAGDLVAEDRMLSELPAEVVVADDRIFAAYINAGRRAQALALLRSLRATHPQLAERIDARIQQIESSQQR